MALIKECKGINPQFGKEIYLAENATIVGDVIMGDNCSVWWQCVVRGDVNAVRIGDRVNIQDLAMIHCTYEKAATTIGDDVSIGHGAIVHGCTLEDNVLVGMGAIIMDHAVVKKNSIIAAGAVVLENTIVEEGTIYAGVPARRVKDVDAEKLENLNKKTAGNYMMYSEWFKEKK